MSPEAALGDFGDQSNSPQSNNEKRARNVPKNDQKHFEAQKKRKIRVVKRAGRIPG